MNINASIVDQRLTGILQDHLALVGGIAKNDSVRQRSLAFVLLCVSTSLELTLAEAAELLTEGGNDAGVDALHLGEVDDGEFTVTIFQGKYKHKDLSGTANFPENGVKAAINTVATLFDPAKQIDLNKELAPRIEEIRSLIRDGYIPNVRVVLCNNGAEWNAQAKQWINHSGFGDQVQWMHFNHDNIVTVLQHKKTVDDAIQLKGKAVIEDFNFRRVLIGKVSVTEIAALFKRHDDLLLERNIRRYLGLHANRVNSAIHQTLQDPAKREDFYFFNNGVTMICRKFRHNALQGENYQLKIEGIQIINGGQTCKTIAQTLDQPDLFAQFSDVYVLLRLYELADGDQEFVRDITYATNSQNPVDLRDLHSNDDIQRQLETGIAALGGYTYKRQRDESSSGPSVITSTIVAEATLAIWRQKPHQAKFFRKEHFGKLYEEIFTNLNASQAVLAVLIFRIVENERKRPDMENPPDFLPYASHYIAMLIGYQLLQENNLDYSAIDHRSFRQLADELNQKKDTYLECARKRIAESLLYSYGGREVSLQQLSATFRRADLLGVLNVPSLMKVFNAASLMKFLPRNDDLSEPPCSQKS